MSSLRVKYFVPEDGDAPEHPNVFTLRLQSDVLTLHSLRQQFPVPGVYQFRFMSSVGSLTVWRDLLYDDDCIPAQNGAVFIKASRLQAAAATSLPSRPEVSAPAKLRPVPALPPREPSTRLLSFEDSPKPAAETDLLGFDAPQNKPAQSLSSPDLFGLESVPRQQLQAPVMKQQPMGAASQFAGAPRQNAPYSGTQAYPYASTAGHGQVRPNNGLDAFSGLTDVQLKKKP